VFDYELLTKEERTLIASGYTTHIVINQRGEVADLPEEVRARIAADNGPEAPRPDRD